MDSAFIGVEIEKKKVWSAKKSLESAKEQVETNIIPPGKYIVVILLIY